jgi:hypothetical protein
MPILTTGIKERVTTMAQQIASMKRFVQTVCSENAFWTGERVLGWMCGIGLPPVGQADQFFVWIWRGIEAVANPDDIKIEFARRLQASASDINRHLFRDRAKFLAPLEQYPGEAAANLWALMRLLDQADILGPVVRDTVRLIPQAAWLHGEKMRAIRARLVSAYPADAIEGILEAPVDGSEQLQDFAEAIAWYAKPGHTKPRREQIIRWLSLCRNRLESSIPNIDEQLILEADRFEWPSWVTSSLEPACIHIISTEGESTAYIWAPIFEEFRGRGYFEPSGETKLSNGEFVCVRGAARASIEAAGRLAEDTKCLRFRDPYVSPASKRALVENVAHQKGVRVAEPVV